LNIDALRIYVCGFSGGGRFAQYYGFTLEEITGVIAISGPKAGEDILPKDPDKTSYVGLVGTKDMNFAEHRSYEFFLDSRRISNTLYIYNSGHRWAPKEYFDKALHWLDMEYLFKKNDEASKILVSKYISQEISRAENLASEDPMAALILYKSLHKNFYPLSDDFGLTAKITKLESSLKKELKADARSLKNELKMQNEFAERLVELKKTVINHSLTIDSIKYILKYWANNIASLKRKEKKDTTDYYAVRQLSFLSGQVFNHANQSMSDNYPELGLIINYIGLMIYPESVQLLWTQIMILYSLDKDFEARPYFKRLEKLDQEELKKVKQMDRFLKYRAQFPQLF